MRNLALLLYLFSSVVVINMIVFVLTVCFYLSQLNFLSVLDYLSPDFAIVELKLVECYCEFNLNHTDLCTFHCGF